MWPRSSARTASSSTRSAYAYGFSSTQTYLNDWIWLPLWFGAWLPVIYYSRVQSIPEYFERRFDGRVGLAVTVLLLVYLLGYIGINFITLGKALDALVPWGIFEWAIVVAIVSGVYVTFGGQTSVIMTDLVQGFLLLIAGFFLLGIGFDYLASGHFIVDASGQLHFIEPGGFWANFRGPLRHALTSFVEPVDFSAVGIFWQDGIANTAAFYFINQGLIMRFLAVRSERDGRKAMFVLVLVLMPLAAIAVSGAGWVGRAMTEAGLLGAVDGDKVFVIVSRLLCSKGVFGLIIAALIAALMSTADTLINAVAAIWVNDIWRPRLRPGREDRYYLATARWVSAISAIVGILLVPLFMQFKSVFDAHGTFTAAITPPLVVAVLLGVLWRGYTSTAAMATLVGGTLAIGLSMLFPELIAPFAHGSAPGGEGPKAYKYLRALFGVIACGSIGVVVSFFTRRKPDDELVGLVIGTRRAAIERFKGSPENTRPGETLRLRLVIDEGVEAGRVRVGSSEQERLAADPGDILYVADRRWWLGGLRSTHARLDEVSTEAGELRLNPQTVEEAQLRVGEQIVVVSKVI